MAREVYNLGSLIGAPHIHYNRER
ncbi:protein of unknown function [Cyanobium sp. NIES-981]|nr:protein of unknown function [Cyanobium sp. NIES-981]